MCNVFNAMECLCVVPEGVAIGHDMSLVFPYACRVEIRAYRDSRDLTIAIDIMV